MTLKSDEWRHESLEELVLRQRDEYLLQAQRERNACGVYREAIETLNKRVLDLEKELRRDEKVLRRLATLVPESYEQALKDCGITALRPGFPEVEEEIKAKAKAKGLQPAGVVDPAITVCPCGGKAVMTSVTRESPIHATQHFECERCGKTCTARVMGNPEDPSERIEE